jgi:hypothetical protein
VPEPPFPIPPSLSPSLLPTVPSDSPTSVSLGTIPSAKVPDNGYAIFNIPRAQEQARFSQQRSAQGCATTHDQLYNVHDQLCNVHDQLCNVHDQLYNLLPMTIRVCLKKTGVNICDNVMFYLK